MFTFLDSIDLSLIRLMMPEQSSLLDDRERNVTPSSRARTRRSGTCNCEILSLAMSSLPSLNNADKSSKIANASRAEIAGTRAFGFVDSTPLTLVPLPFGCFGISKAILTCRSILPRVAETFLMLVLTSSSSRTRRSNSLSLVRNVPSELISCIPLSLSIGL